MEAGEQTSRGRRLPEYLASYLRPMDRKFRLARAWSNDELRKIAPTLTGSVINVSGWQDADKQGGYYRDYFSGATEYLVSNHTGTRGSDDGTTDIDLDLTKELSDELVGCCDVAFNHTTLEHIFEVQQAFRNLSRLTRDLLILVVPFVQEQHFTADYGDYWRFTPQVLHLLGAENGLKTVLVRWNDHRNAATYILWVGSRHPDRHRFLPEQFGQQEGVPGSWVGRRRILEFGVKVIRGRTLVVRGRPKRV